MKSVVSVFAVLALAFAMPPPVHADPAGCQKQIVRRLFKFKKDHLRAHTKCLDRENRSLLPGPCPDTTAQLKINTSKSKAIAAISAKCTMADIAALGFPGDCAFEAVGNGIEGTCAGLPVTTPSELASCLLCWKGAELSEFIGILFASHAVEVCGGALDETSPVCSDIDCTTPLPDQRNLGDTSEADCHLGIGKGGFKYVVKREKALEKCALAGGTRATCLADLTVQESLAKAELVKDVTITRKCGNRDPAPNPPFCCKTTGNMCVAAADRFDCVANLSGTVQEDKTCNAGNCDPVAGNKKVTWWAYCPESNTCPGTALASLQDLIDCVDTTADAIVDELLCLQFPRNGGADWPCPAGDGSPSGAFLDPA
jgi:hypothetical protein